MASNFLRKCNKINIYNCFIVNSVLCRLSVCCFDFFILFMTLLIFDCELCESAGRRKQREREQFPFPFRHRNRMCDCDVCIGLVPKSPSQSHRHFVSFASHTEHHRHRQITRPSLLPARRPAGTVPFQVPVGRVERCGLQSQHM